MLGCHISENITELFARAKGLQVLTGRRCGGESSRARRPCRRRHGSNAFAHNEHPELILDAAKAVLARTVLPWSRSCMRATCSS